MWQLCCSFKGLNFLQLLHQIGYAKEKEIFTLKVSNTWFINGIEAHWYLCISREWDLEFLVNCNPSFISKKKKPREEHWPSYIQVKDFKFCESNNNIFSRWNIKRRIFLLERVVYSCPGSQMDLWLYDFHILILKTLIISALHPVSR